MFVDSGDQDENLPAYFNLEHAKKKRNKSDYCFLCNVHCGLIKKRHYCTVCGQSVCDNCS